MVRIRLGIEETNAYRIPGFIETVTRTRDKGQGLHCYDKDHIQRYYISAGRRTMISTPS